MSPALSRRMEQMTAQGPFQLNVCMLKIPQGRSNLAAESNSSWSCTCLMDVLRVQSYLQVPFNQAMFLCLASDIFRDVLFFVDIWSGVFLIILLMAKNVKFVLMQEAQSAFDQFKQMFTSVPVQALQNLSRLRLMHSAMWWELHPCNIGCPKMNLDYVHWNLVSLHNNSRILRFKKLTVVKYVLQQWHYHL